MMQSHSQLARQPLTLKATDTLSDPPLAHCLRQAAASDHVGYASWGPVISFDQPCLLVMVADVS